MPETPPDLLLGSGLQPAAIRFAARALARRSGHPVGILKLPGGSTQLCILSTPERLSATFDETVQPGQASSDLDIPTSGPAQT